MKWSWICGYSHGIRIISDWCLISFIVWSCWLMHFYSVGFCYGYCVIYFYSDWLLVVFELNLSSVSPFGWPSVFQPEYLRSDIGGKVFFIGGIGWFFIRSEER